MLLDVALELLDDADEARELGEVRCVVVVGAGRRGEDGLDGLAQPGRGRVVDDELVEGVEVREEGVERGRVGRRGEERGAEEEGAERVGAADEGGERRGREGRRLVDRVGLDVARELVDVLLLLGRGLGTRGETRKGRCNESSRVEKVVLRKRERATSFIGRGTRRISKQSSE